MPLGRDTRVIPSNTVLNRGPGPPREREDLGSEAPSSLAAMPPNAKLHWPLVFASFLARSEAILVKSSVTQSAYRQK